MMPSYRPIRTTIFWGIVCGLIFVPLVLSMNTVVAWPRAVGLVLWLHVAGYAILLTRWGQKRIFTIAFPLILLALCIFLANSINAFFLLALLIIGWIRSGLCFQNRAGTRLAVEVLLCTIGAVMVTIFRPASLSAWALGIWLFFLVQSLYFVIFEDLDGVDAEFTEVDPFENASRQAEAILSTLTRW